MQVILKMLNRITIVGSGSWATALAKLFSESGMNVSWLVRDQELADYINTSGRNPRYLSSVKFNRSYISAVAIAGEAFKDSAMIIFAVPSAYLKDTLKKIEPQSVADIPLAVSIKGFIPGTGSTPSRFLAAHFDRKKNDIMVLGGPCHAEEIASQKNTYLTVAGTDSRLVGLLCSSLTCHYIRAIASNDPSGIEHASILKNIIGIASGIANGLLYGDNFQAVLISNAMREANHFINAVEPASRDLFQSAYFGDLLVTAYSDFSRNRTLGKLVGRGFQVNKAIQTMEMVAEGFSASKELAPAIKRSKVHAPVMNAVYRILHKHANPYSEFKLLEEQFT